MRDNALALGLRRLGHSVTLIPLFTPLRTEPDDASIPSVFYGGVNIYLQHATRLFQRTPRLLDWLLDRKWLLALAGRYGATTPPAQLGELTLSILRGQDGSAVKELRRLLAFMKSEVRPQIVCLPNLMFIGIAPVLKQELGVPVVCTLSGEDVFLDALSPKDGEAAQQLIGAHGKHVDQFIATSREYARKMTAYLDISHERINVVHPGISQTYLATPARSGRATRTSTVGFLSRICPEKGLHRLIDAMLLLWKMPDMQYTRLRVAGYLGKGHRKYYEEQQARVTRAGKSALCDFRGELSREEKIAFLDGCDCVSIPTEYVESKGISVIEAWARRVPVVQPAHGSFPELIEVTGGGVLVPPGDATALAEALAKLLRDPTRREQMGQNGRDAVKTQFTDERMAQQTLDVFSKLLAANCDTNHAEQPSGTHRDRHSQVLSDAR